MDNYLHRPTLGVVGGLGPLASAEFLKTIYECGIGTTEQSAACVVMYSDPTFPDRTEALLKNDARDLLLAKLIGALHFLSQSGAEEFVICCVTIHALISELPDDLRGKILSLVDVIFDGVVDSRKRHLLLCSNGARRFEIFESHPRWTVASDYFVRPSDGDQQLIHRMIYDLKINRDVKQLIPALDSLLVKYQVDSFIAGCTEMHLITKFLKFSSMDHPSYGSVDPLTIIAKRMVREIK